VCNKNPQLQAGLSHIWLSLSCHAHLQSPGRHIRKTNHLAEADKFGSVQRSGPLALFSPRRGFFQNEPFTRSLSYQPQLKSKLPQLIYTVCLVAFI
jgi:hypothetical protein